MLSKTVVNRSLTVTSPIFLFSLATLILLASQATRLIHISTMFDSDQSSLTTNTTTRNLMLDGIPQEVSTHHYPYTWDAQGCQNWTGTKKDHLTGIVVTLILPPDEQGYKNGMRKVVCDGSIASQRHHLLNPQQWDMLLILGKARPDDPTWMTMDEIAECWQFAASNVNYTLQTWENLDGTTLVTRRYQDPTSNHTIFVAESQLSYPEYIQNNLTLLQHKIKPDLCNAPRSYIQGTRWYTHEMLELSILQSYDYFAKIDADVWFFRTIPFDILWDLQLRNALLMHTASYESAGGSASCGKGIVEAVQQFQQTESATIEGWKGAMCSAGQREVQKDIDLYYTNFIVGRVDFWQSPGVRALGKFLTNYPRGFFYHRWTDQIFYHFAMGLFLGPDFKEYVADYTDLRCAPVKNCWQASFNFDRFGYQPTCPNGAYFEHTKFLKVPWNKTVMAHEVERSPIPRVSDYQENCSGLLA